MLKLFSFAGWFLNSYDLKLWTEAFFILYNPLKCESLISIDINISMINGHFIIVALIQKTPLMLQYTPYTWHFTVAIDVLK